MTTETLQLMKKHTSVRRFTEERIPDDVLKEIIEAGQAASSWKNFQSYSIIIVRRPEIKEALYQLVPQEAIRQASAFLLFVGDLNRASKGVALHTDAFYPDGVENLLITSVDASLAAQNTLLAAESLGYGGVIIGLIRHVAQDLVELFELPDYTYPIFGIALGVPAQHHAVKPRLPYDSVVFEEKYQQQDTKVILDYDKVQAEYVGKRAQDTWSERLASQFGQEPNDAIHRLVTEKKKQ